MNVKSFITGVVLVVLSPFFVQGQLLDPVSFSISNAPDQVKAGEIFSITVKASIDGDWHLYSSLNDPDAGPYPTTLSVTNDYAGIAGEIKETEAKIVLDPNFNEKLGWHSNEAEFTVPVAFRENVQGVKELEIDILYQVCDDKSCLPPKVKSVHKNIEVAGLSDSPYDGFDESNKENRIINSLFVNRKAFVISLLLLLLAGVGLVFRLVYYKKA